MRNWLTDLHRPVDGRLLALFRIVFGIAMFYEMSDWRSIGLVQLGIVAPKLLFTYEGLAWITPFSEHTMDLILAGAALAALCMAAGLFHRIAAVYFWAAFTFLFLQDKAFYNNHLYLFSLLALLLCFMPASRVWSLDALLFRKDRMPRTVPVWTTMLLRIQFVIVYFYGGLAKLNSDWLLHQQPMRTALDSVGPAMHDLATSAFSVYFFTYGGLLFDLCIGALLWAKRTRRYAIPFALAFNITNHFLFDDIGVFPFVMIPSILLFFDPEEFAAWLDRGKAKGKKAPGIGEDVLPTTLQRSVANVLIVCYLAFQLLFPLRWMVLPGHVDWTTIGQRFSWRMKITSRSPQRIAYYFVAPNGEKRAVDANAMINSQQLMYTAEDVRMAVQFAHFLKRGAAEHGHPEFKVTSEIVISYNGRPVRYLFPPDQDLSALTIDPWHPDEWVPPLLPQDPAYFPRSR